MIKDVVKKIKRHCWGLGGLLTLCIFTKSWGFVPSVPSYVIWAVQMLILFNVLKFKARPYKMALAFLAFCPVGILLAHPDPCFKSWLRYGNFALLFLAIAPVFFCRPLREVRRQAVNTVCLLSVLTALGSFVCFFLGINYMRMMGSEELLYSSAGKFGGLCVHSMTLGPLSAIAVVTLFYQFLQCKSKIIIAFMCMSMGSVFFTASRSSLAAAIVGIIAVACFLDSKKLKPKKMLAIMGVCAAVTFPLWKGSLYLMEQKQLNNNEMGSMTVSRDVKYKYRFDEFKSSPVYGIGFCAIDKHGGDEYQEATGTIEPGTSWGAVLSMTGLVGFLLFLGVIKRAYQNIKQQKTMQRGLLMGLLLLFLVHFVAEGYVLSAGNEFCFISWLVVAACCENWTKESREDVFLFDLVKQK